MASSEETFAMPADANRTSTSVEDLDEFLRRKWKEVCKADASGIASRPEETLATDSGGILEGFQYEVSVTDSDGIEETSDTDSGGIFTRRPEEASVLDTGGRYFSAEEIQSKLPPGKWDKLLEYYRAKVSTLSWKARTGDTAGPKEAMARLHRGKSHPEEILADPLLAALHDAYKASVSVELLEYTYHLIGWWKEKFEMIPREGETVPRKKLVLYGVPDIPRLISTEMEMYKYLEDRNGLEEVDPSEFEWGNIADEAEMQAVYYQALKLSMLPDPENRTRSKGSSSREGVHEDSCGITRPQETLAPSLAPYLAKLHDAYKASVTAISLACEFYESFYIRLPGWWKEVYEMIPREGKNVPWKRVVLYRAPNHPRLISSEIEMDAYLMGHPKLAGSVLTAEKFEWGNIAGEGELKAVYEQVLKLSMLPELENRRSSEGSSSREGVHEDTEPKQSVAKKIRQGSIS